MKKKIVSTKHFLIQLSVKHGFFYKIQAHRDLEYLKSNELDE